MFVKIWRVQFGICFLEFVFWNLEVGGWRLEDGGLEVVYT